LNVKLTRACSRPRNVVGRRRCRRGKVPAYVT
jgi:hypothetical protein